VQALAEMKKSEFQDLPLGGFAGEVIVASATPAPQLPPKPAIPPPPWAGREAELLASLPDEADEPELTALEAMKLNDDGYEPEPWQPPPPPTQPLLPLEIPPADWRAEEVARARRDRKQPLLDEPEKSLRSRPA
jgi:hypothetical protein